VGYRPLTLPNSSIFRDYFCLKQANAIALQPRIFRTSNELDEDDLRTFGHVHKVTSGDD
jgi:hypothetical protein